MKFLFVAPRFHTNQFPIVKGLIEKGHQVEFFVQYIGKGENHSILKPRLMKKSILTGIIFNIIDRKYDANQAESKKPKRYIPALFDTYKRIREYHPDIVILRNANRTTSMVCIICKILGIKAVMLYNQEPLYKKTKKTNMFNLLFQPKVTFTPVLFGNIEDLIECQTERHEYFLPFVAETNASTAVRGYLQNKKVRILDVGKYREYKNHFILVDAIELLQKKEELSVTITGQVGNEEEQKYFKLLQEYVTSKSLDNFIKLEKNIPHTKMSDLYLAHDVFVLTSKRETASIAVLEAMANGLVAISTDANGTACYIRQGECGYLFKTMDKESLAETLRKVIESKESIVKKGRMAYLDVKNNYSFENYYTKLRDLVKKEFGLWSF